MLIKKIIEKLEKNSCETKVQDALKAIQLKHKLASASKVGTSSGKSHTSDAGKMFWEMIEQIRKEELGKLAFQPREDRMKSKKSKSDTDSKDSVGPADAQPVNRSTNRKGGPG